MDGLGLAALVIAVMYVVGWMLWNDWKSSQERGIDEDEEL